MTASTGTDERESTPVEELCNATESLMNWCLKNVDKWDFPQFDNASRRLEKVRASLGAAQVPAREYYCRVNECRAVEATEPDCICWHKAGTGPFPTLVEGGEREKLEPYIWRDALAGAAQVPAGWKLVPVEPTTGMVKAASELAQTEREHHAEVAVPGDNFMGPVGEDYYRAMLDAAPEPTAGAAQVPSLPEALMSKLRRFAETTEDDQQYDIGKIAVRQLAQAGALRHMGGSRYQLTEYGDWLLSQPSQQGTKS